MMKLILLAGLLVVVGAVENRIFSFDNGVERDSVLSLTVDPDTKRVGLTTYNATDGDQRIIKRDNSDGTFMLFPETQPWNWVDHIVETTKYIRIRKVPQVLTGVGPTKEVVEQNYKGKNTGTQRWYVVPTGEDPNTGVVVNWQLKLCLLGQGENQPLALADCKLTDPNQRFTLSLRTFSRRA